MQIAESLIRQRNGLRIARYGKRAAVYGKIVRREPVRHGDAAAAILGVVAERQCAVQRQRAVAENGKGVIALNNSVQAPDGILSVQRDKERTLISDILFAQAHRGQVGILELQIRENTAVLFKPAGRINFQNILGCQIIMIPKRRKVLALRQNKGGSSVAENIGIIVRRNLDLAVATIQKQTKTAIESGEARNIRGNGIAGLIEVKVIICPPQLCICRNAVRAGQPLGSGRSKALAVFHDNVDPVLLFAGHKFNRPQLNNLQIVGGKTCRQLKYGAETEVLNRTGCRMTVAEVRRSVPAERTTPRIIAPGVLPPGSHRPPVFDIPGCVVF